MAIFLSDGIDLRAKTITTDKEGHYSMKKGLIYWGSNNPKSMWLRQATEPHNIWSKNSRGWREKATNPQCGWGRRHGTLSDCYKSQTETQHGQGPGPHSQPQISHTECPTQHYHTLFFFKCPGDSHKISHILGHKISLNKMLKIEIIQNTFFDHNSINITLVINDTKTRGKSLNTW